MYGHPNLITEYITNKATIDAPAGCDPDDTATQANGLTSWSGASTCHDSAPIYKLNDSNGFLDERTHRCYRACADAFTDHELKLTLTFEKEYFQHAILITGSTDEDYDMLVDPTPIGTLNNVYIYIGNSLDPDECEECPDGPFLTDTNGRGPAGYWRGGDEIWCNLPGKYTHIIVDKSSFNDPTNYKVNICSLGVIGNSYDRATEPTSTL